MPSVRTPTCHVLSSASTMRPPTLSTSGALLRVIVWVLIKPSACCADVRVISSLLCCGVGSDAERPELPLLQDAARRLLEIRMVVTGYFLMAWLLLLPQDRRCFAGIRPFPARSRLLHPTGLALRLAGGAGLYRLVRRRPVICQKPLLRVPGGAGEYPKPPSREVGIAQERCNNRQAHWLGFQPAVAVDGAPQRLHLRGFPDCDP